MKEERARELLGKLVTDPDAILSAEVYELTEQYINGYPLDTLRPFFSSEHERVQQAVAAIVSELGAAAAPLVDDVVPLVSSTNAWARFDALEVLFLCGTGEKSHLFSHVLSALKDVHPEIRMSAMEFISRALPEQIVEGADVLAEKSQLSEQDARILRKIGQNTLSRDEVLALVASTNGFEHTCGMLALARDRQTFANDRERLMPTLSADDQELLRRVERFWASFKGVPRR